MSDVSKIKIGETSYDIKDETARACLHPVGDIIFNAICDTEAKVIAAYGGNSWAEITDKFILAAGSTFVADSTGGNADAIIPYHNHTFTGTASTHSHKMNYDANNSIATSSSSLVASPYGSTAAVTSVQSTSITPAGTISYAGTNGNTTNANMPPYVAKYVWQRTS